MLLQTIQNLWQLLFTNPGDVENQRESPTRCSTTEGSTCSTAGSPGSPNSCKRRGGDSDPRLESSIRILQQRVDALAEDNRRLKAEAAVSNEQAETYRKQWEQEVDQHRQDQKEYAGMLDAASANVEAWRNFAEQVEQERSAVQKTQENTEELLRLRTEELQSAQTFLSKVDNVALAQIRSMVENLNALSSQLASILTDELTFPEDANAVPASSQAEVARFMGGEMTDALIAGSHDNDTTMVFVALLGTICYHAACFISCWDVTLNSEQNDLLTTIHSRMFEIEPQAVSARWRALARHSLSTVTARHDLISTASETLSERLRVVMLVAGGVQDNHLGGPDAIKIIRNIVSLCLDIQHAIGEDIASTDLLVLYPRPGTPFSSDAMEDSDDIGSGGVIRSLEGVPVLCTSELGLKRRDRREGQTETVEERILVKAKVALSMVGSTQPSMTSSMDDLTLG